MKRIVPNKLIISLMVLCLALLPMITAFTDAPLPPATEESQALPSSQSEEAGLDLPETPDEPLPDESAEEIPSPSPEEEVASAEEDPTPSPEAGDAGAEESAAPSPEAGDAGAEESPAPSSEAEDAATEESPAPSSEAEDAATEESPAPSPEVSEAPPSPSPAPEYQEYLPETVPAGSVGYVQSPFLLYAGASFASSVITSLSPSDGVVVLSMNGSWALVSFNGLEGFLPLIAKPVETAAVEEPAVEEPAAEEPTVEEPATEEPAVEEPIAEEPAVEEPVAEEPTAEEPAVEEPIAEKPVVEEPSVEEPIAEEPAVEEPAVEEPIAEEPVVEEPMAEEPIAEEPAIEEPEVEEPIAEEPAVEEPIAEEEPAVEEPIAEEPVAEEEPAVEEPISEEQLAHAVPVGTLAVGVSNLYLHASPSADSDKLALLPPDSLVKVLSNDGTWANIDFNGQIGYLPLINLVPEAPSASDVQPAAYAWIIQNEEAHYGDTIGLGARIVGMDGLNYTTNWQYAPGGGGSWVDEPGATSLNYSYTLSESNANWAWRIAVYLQDPPQVNP